MTSKCGAAASRYGSILAISGVSILLLFTLYYLHRTETGSASSASSASHYTPLDVENDVIDYWVVSRSPFNRGQRNIFSEMGGVCKDAATTMCSNEKVFQTWKVRGWETQDDCLNDVANTIAVMGSASLYGCGW